MGQCWERWLEISKTVNDKIEYGFEVVGRTVATWPYVFLGLTLVIFGGLSFGLFNFNNAFETQLFNLFTPTNSPVFDERAFVENNWNAFDTGQITIDVVGKNDQDLLSVKALNELYDLQLKWTAEVPEKNVTWGNQTVLVSFFAQFNNPPFISQLDPNKKWGRTLQLCAPFSTTPAPAQFFMPCLAFDVFDCFAEGGWKFPMNSYLNLTSLKARLPASPYLIRPSFRGLNKTQLGAILGKSCSIWTGSAIPFGFLMGGESRVNGSNSTSPLTSVKSYQTIFLAASADNLVRRFNMWTGKCKTAADGVNLECPQITDSERNDATKILNDWYLDFINYFEAMAKTHNEDSSKELRIVFFTPRSVGDLLRLASSADFGLLVLAFGLMIVFAAAAAIRPSNWFGSKVEASVAGVLLVLLTVVATIGFGVLVVKLSPNVIQILPFIALGFGVDDMFVLLFAYRYEEKGHGDTDHVPRLIGQTLRVAGSSVALTSLANLLAFAVGSTMPLPDVSRFSKYGMIVVSFNFLAIIFGFTAVLTLTARRQAAGKADFAFVCCFGPASDADPRSDPDPDETASTLLDPLYDVLANTYVRIAVLIIAATLFAIGIWGATLARVGLPLDRILPSGFYASSFLAVRVQYYGSYTQNIYTNADGRNLKTIDWPNMVGKLANLSLNIRSFDSTLNKLVYATPSLTNSWAVAFTKNNRAEHPKSFTPSKVDNSKGLTSFNLKTPTAPVDPFECQQAINRFCSRFPFEFRRGSQLLFCLQHNIFVIEQSKCRQQVLQLATPPLPPSATVVQVVAPSNGNASGFFTSPFGDTSATFVKYIDTPPVFRFGDGHIYQRPPTIDRILNQETGTWAVLDRDGVVIYTAPATAARSLPPRTGWRKLDGKPAGIEIVVSNAITAALKVPRQGFPANASKILTHDFEFKTMVGSGARPSEGYQLFRQELAGRTAWGGVSVTFTDTASQTTTSAVCTDPTSSVPGGVCVALGNPTTRSMFTGATCNSSSTVDQWWTGKCQTGTNTGPTIVYVKSPTNDPLNFTAGVSPNFTQDTSGANYKAACDCRSNGPPPGSSNYMQFQPQYQSVGTNPQWASPNLGVDSTKNSCQPRSAEVSVKCIPQNCGRIEACYAELQAANIRCSVSDLQPSSAAFFTCVPRLFLLPGLSSCCTEALLKQLQLIRCSELTNPGLIIQFLPQTIAGTEATTRLCDAHPYCLTTKGPAPFFVPSCGDQCSGVVERDCAGYFEFQQCQYNHAVPPATNMAVLKTCLETVANYTGKQRTCCQNSLTLAYIAGQAPAPTQECLGHFSTLWNGTHYNYKPCTPFTALQGCGTFNDSIQQIRCLLASNMTQLTLTPGSACCSKFLTQIKPSSIIDPFTRLNQRSITQDCSGDAYSFGVLTPTINPLGFVLPNIVAALQGAVLQARVLKSNNALSLSPFCLEAIQYCPTSVSPDSYSPVFSPSIGEYQQLAGRAKLPGGRWMQIQVGQNQTAECPWGFTGTYRRPCINDPKVGPKWGAIDNSTCVQLKCPAKTFATLPVPETPAGSQWITVLPSSAPGSACTNDPNILQYIAHRCVVNNTNHAYWDTPNVLCAPRAFSTTGEANKGCDVSKSSLLSADPVPIEPIPQLHAANLLRALRTAQGSCQLNPTCVAVEVTEQWNSRFQVSKAVLSYDYCVRTDVTNSTLYVAPLDPFRLLCTLCTSKLTPPDASKCVNPSDGVPLPSCFYNLLWWYLYNPLGFGFVDRDRFVFGSEQYRRAVTNSTGFLTFQPVAGGPPVIKSTRISFAVQGITDDVIAVDYIQSVRAMLKTWNDAGVPSIASGIIFDLYSQYIGVSTYIWQNCVLVGALIAVVCLLFLWNPVAVLVVLICDGMMITEVMGFVEWSGLRINGVLALNIVIAIGLTMEFTAHMARAFVVTDNSFAKEVGMAGWSEGQVRMKKAMRAMFIPITLGAATTLLGISPIAGAQFPYFVQYYFLLYVLIVCFGWFNGVVAQPVLLSFFNPRAFPKNKNRIGEEIAMSVTVGSDMPRTGGRNEGEGEGQGTTTNF